MGLSLIPFFPSLLNSFSIPQVRLRHIVRARHVQGLPIAAVVPGGGHGGHAVRDRAGLPGMLALLPGEAGRRPHDLRGHRDRHAEPGKGESSQTPDYVFT